MLVCWRRWWIRQKSISDYRMGSSGWMIWGGAGTVGIGCIVGEFGVAGLIKEHINTC